MTGPLGFFDVMGAPLAGVLVFSLILAYLGVHIIRRQVIFVDLALGQTAALGATVGFLYGLGPGSIGAYLFSLGFALSAAAIFAISRPPEHSPIPHEAVIGLVFAVAAAAGYIVVDRSAHGAEHVTAVLTGKLLWITWRDVLQAVGVVGIVGTALGGLHKQLVAQSGSSGQGTRSAGWDFAFYAAFGLVVSVTVRTAGVLPTFAMLVAPAIFGSLVARRFEVQFLVTWVIASLTGAASLVVAFAADWDGGPTLVLMQGLVLLVGVLVLYVVRAEHRVWAAGRVAVGLVVAGVVIAAILLGGRHLARARWANPELSESSPSTQLEREGVPPC